MNAALKLDTGCLFLSNERKSSIPKNFIFSHDRIDSYREHKRVKPTNHDVALWYIGSCNFLTRMPGRAFAFSHGTFIYFFFFLGPIALIVSADLVLVLLRSYFPWKGCQHYLHRNGRPVCKRYECFQTLTQKRGACISVKIRTIPATSSVQNVPISD